MTCLHFVLTIYKFCGCWWQTCVSTRWWQTCVWTWWWQTCVSTIRPFTHCYIALRWSFVCHHYTSGWFLSFLLLKGRNFRMTTEILQAAMQKTQRGLDEITYILYVRFSNIFLVDVFYIFVKLSLNFVCMGCQAITYTNYDLVHWYHMTSPGHNLLRLISEINALKTLFKAHILMIRKVILEWNFAEQ